MGCKLAVYEPVRALYFIPLSKSIGEKKVKVIKYEIVLKSKILKVFFLGKISQERKVECKWNDTS